MAEEDESARLNFIPCLTWVKRGVAKSEPDKVKLSDDDLKLLLQKGSSENPPNLNSDSSSSDTENEDHMKDGEVNNSAEHVESANDEDSTVIKKYGFDNYDLEEASSSVVGDFAGLTVYASNKEDPYVTLPDDSDNDSEKEDEIIKPTDNLILVGHVDGDQASLEVYLHNEEEESLYVHHEIFLPDLPFCLEWLNYDPSSAADGNLCAIGGMNPVIHVMDLDIVNCLEPAYSLGNCELKSSDPFASHFGKKLKKGKQKQKYVGHRDAVLDLSWNTNYSHVLASGSVDQTVILWDLETGSVNSTLDAFKEKVQAINWHPFEGQTLLSGSCDMAARVFDCRSKDSYKAWKLPGEVERAIWDHYNPFFFLASTDNGYVYYVDCRNDKPVWELAAHSKEVTGLALSSSCPGLLFTGSNDGFVKVWDIANSSQPVHVWHTNPKLGNLHCLGSNPDSPFTIAVGGDKKSLNLGVWDLIDNSAIRARFAQRPLLVPKKEENLEDTSQSVMETVASAMDDLCLSLENDSSDKLKKLPSNSRTIKKKRKNLLKKIS